MKLISLTLARNPAWVIEATIHHALRYVDAAVVLLHNTTDTTPQLLAPFGDRVTVLRRDEADWDEMVHRQTVLETGRQLGGTHFLILDDDEILTHNLVDRVRPLVEPLPAGQCLSLPLLSCWRSLDQYRSDNCPLGRAHKTSFFRDAPGVGWRDTNGYQHHHTQPYNTHATVIMQPAEGGFMHLQHAHWPRLVLKQTWYMCMELCRWGQIRANYRGSMDEKGLTVAPIAPDWWNSERNLLNLTAVPWQHAELQRMVAARGPEFFASHGVDVLPYTTVPQ